ncbi:hypothetical protein ACVH9Z_18595 [Rhodococcus opacus]|uniref:hypothetical protein n=1 Tax=Rhodococcus opacus TaxID=37919 RepID=UPI001B304B5D|nr:hypothetical protein [Rhodococcus opacus]
MIAALGIFCCVGVSDISAVMFCMSAGQGSVLAQEFGSRPAGEMAPRSVNMNQDDRKGEKRILPVFSLFGR